MDPEDAGKMVGRMIPLVLALGLVAGVATRAAKLSPRSQRLGRYAVACGLAFLPLLCVATFARGPEGRVVMLGVGGLMVAAGAAAITLAARARSARTGDGGRPWAAVPGGILLGLVSITLGGGAILIPRVANPGGPAGPVADGTAWTHRVDPPGFEVALPSDRWRRYEKPNTIALFGCPSPQMMAVVKEVRPARTTGDFERAVGDLKGLVSKNPVTVAEERREPNPHGHDHWRFLGEERSPNGRVMVAMSVTWWNKSHAVVMIFEGQHRLASEAGQDQELQGYQGAARLILSSVR